MALLLKQLHRSYKYLIVDLADPRSEDWPLVRSPIPLVAVIVIYYIFVTSIGPEFMKNRKPYNLRKVLICYNAFQVTINFTLTLYFTPLFLDLNWSCAEIDYSPDMILQTIAGYIYYLMKYVDLLDTVFFVLRKKYNQITFLHIYHHAMIICLGWVGTKYLGGGHSGFIPYINSWVHVFMYSYYLASIVTNNAKSVIRWKKHMTQLQLTQFGLLLIIYLMPLFNSSCNFPKTALYLVLPQNFIMFMLFGDFYYRAYIMKKKSTA